jgi:hypothetical protein
VLLSCVIGDLNCNGEDLQDKAANKGNRFFARLTVKVEFTKKLPMTDLSWPIQLEVRLSNSSLSLLCWL